MRISDWSSDVCSADLAAIGVDFRHADIVQFERLRRQLGHRVDVDRVFRRLHGRADILGAELEPIGSPRLKRILSHPDERGLELVGDLWRRIGRNKHVAARRSEEHTSELQSLMRISYAVFCLKNKNNTRIPPTTYTKN